jgi:hypothetical protein
VPDQPRAGEAGAAAAIARAQQLVESRPRGRYTVRWCEEARQFGDLQAIGALLLCRAEPNT